MPCDAFENQCYRQIAARRPLTPVKYRFLFKNDPQWGVFPEEAIPELVRRLGGTCEGPEGEHMQRWHVYRLTKEAIENLRSSLVGRDYEIITKDESHIEIREC